MCFLHVLTVKRIIEDIICWDSIQNFQQKILIMKLTIFADNLAVVFLLLLWYLFLGSSTYGFVRWISDAEIEIYFCI